MKFKLFALGQRVVVRHAAFASSGKRVSQQVVTLRVHHFLPQSATGHAKVIEPWCIKLPRSGNKLKVPNLHFYAAWRHARPVV